MVNYDVRWEGDGTKEILGHSLWVNQDEMNKPGRHVVYTYGVFSYLLGRDPSSALNPFICEISQEESYKVVQDDRDFTYGFNTSDPNMVPQGPRFLIQPRSIVVVGKALAATFECVAHGNPQPDYKITKIANNGSQYDITASWDPRYTLTNGKLSIQSPEDIHDAGTYFCTAENEIGRVRSDYLYMSFGSLGDFSNVDRAPVMAYAHQFAVIDCLPPTYTPAVSYQWYKDDKQFVRPDLHTYIFISRNGKLYFSEVSTPDRGNYRCIVKLTAHNGAAIGTDQPPSRTSLPTLLDVQNGIPTVWGPEISNEFISVHPRTPQKGQRVYLECLAFGTMPITYTWSRHGLPMSPRASFSDHNRVMMIDDVQIEDGGTYICHASRYTTARTQKNVTLVIESKPFFSYPLKHQHVDIGSKLTWRCEATAMPEPVYEWFKDGVRLSNIPGKLNIVRNVLTLQNLQTTDNGMYQCSAENIYGKSFTEGQLRVLAFAPTFVKEPLAEIIYGVVGGNITYPCNPEAAPTPTYTWLKNNVELGLNPGDTTSRVRMLQNGNLLILNINLGDVAYYTCRVENQLGRVSSTGQLQIADKVVISLPPVNVQARVNQTAFLRCQASYNSFQDVIYSWLFNDQFIDIKSDVFYRQGVSQSLTGLYVTSVQFKHSGKYTCRAQTTHEHYEAWAYLTVLGPPAEPAGVYAIQSSIGTSSLQLSWTVGAANGGSVLFHTVEAMPVMSNEWYIAVAHVSEMSSIVPGQDTSKRIVEVPGLNPGTGYRFRVFSTNTFGVGIRSRVSDAYTTRYGPPTHAPSHVGGGYGSVGDLTITWMPLEDYQLGGPGIGYLVYYRRNLTETWTKVSLTGNVGKYITQVGAYNYYLLYDVMVQAFNDYGSGPNSTVNTIYSAEEIPTISITNVQAYPFNSSALMVTWDPVPDTREAMKGKLLGYQVNYWERFTKDPIMNSISWRGQMSQGLVIGLLPDTWYTVNLQALNMAGMSQISETDFQLTLKMAPRMYPTEIHVGSDGSQSVFVTWRGVTTGIEEEPIQGYILRYWLDGDDIRTASDVRVGKVDSAIIYGIQKNYLYCLRVLGFSIGGDGTMSELVYFTLGGRIAAVDQSLTEIKATASHLQVCYYVILSVCIIQVLTKFM
ncbi:contactin-3-like isoform X2 [Crassostrea virginica]